VIVMADTGPATPAQVQPSLVTLPAEIDMANAARIGEQLAAAFAPGVGVVIADMTATTFCDSVGIGMLLLACRRAAAVGTELRLLLPCPRVLTVMKIIGVDAVLPIYLSLEQALAGPGIPASETWGPPGAGSSTARQASSASP
jgi:anti-sigma B factor antagonist